MNAIELLDAMTDIDDRFLCKAQARMGYGPAMHRRGRLLRRTLALAAAVLLLLAAGLTTAVAMDRDFREEFFRFLRLEEQPAPENEIDHPLTPEDMYAEPVFQIGEKITGQYVHTPVATHARSGVYLVCTDPVEMRQGSHYQAYYEENGALLPLENHDFKGEYTLYGCSIPLAFSWAEHNGIPVLTWNPPDSPLKMLNQYESARQVFCQVLLTFPSQTGEPAATWYPVLLDLATGELTDILAGTQASNLLHIENAAISPDGRAVVMQQHLPDGYKLFYADLDTHTLYDLDELSGQRTDACVLLENALVCWQKKGDHFQIWKLDRTAFQRMEVLENGFDSGATPQADAGVQFLQGFDDWSHSGNSYAGTRFALLVDDHQAVSVLDLESGEITLVPGLVWPQDAQRDASPDGRKVMLVQYNDKDLSTRVGVLDLTTKKYVEFIKHYTSPESIEYAYWFTNDSVLFASTPDGDSLCSDYTIYRLGTDS